MAMGLRGLAALALAAAALARPTNEEWKQARQDEADQAKAAAAKQAKMKAVDTVVNLMTELQKEVAEEGEKEAATYDKFACWCKDVTGEKTTQIQDGKDAQSSLSTAINGLRVDRDGLDELVAKLVEEIEGLEKQISQREGKKKMAKNEYKGVKADLKAGMVGLEGAIKAMKASKEPSLLQLRQVSGTVREALLLADALGLGGAPARRAAAALLQQPTEDYNFHSGGIIETLETLQKDFKDTELEVDTDHTKNIASLDSQLQELDHQLKQASAELEDAKKEKEEKQEAIASSSEELTTVAAELLDNQQYLSEAAKMCYDRAKTWDQRSKVRADELSVLTSVIGIVKNAVGGNVSAATLRLAEQGFRVRRAEDLARSPAALEALEAEAEDVEAGGRAVLLQRGPGRNVTVHPAAKVASNESRPKELPQQALGHNVTTHPAVQAAKGSSFLARGGGRQPADVGPGAAVATVLRIQGDRLHSSVLTALASRIAADPFAKIKELIKELVERLKEEAANEATQKGWCDKSMTASKEKRDTAARNARELNGEMGELEARRDRLTEEIGALAAAIADLKKQMNVTEEERQEEKAENLATIQEAKLGKEATELAVKTLKEFYARARKGKVDLELAQRGPMDDAPDAGFDAGEAYTGGQGEAGGILGMLDVILSDFERTVKTTTAAEENARQDHVAFMRETSMSHAEKESAEKEKSSLLEKTKERLAEAEEDLEARMERLTSAIKELLELQPACVDTGMSYEERAALREGEIQALKKALCVLQNYEKYGPEGMGDC
mmetsp:Transcript_118075/g.381092  ORF Transcript_118075/g.381092 Transcript_118075/m.381092 type:complete len:787 (-) Transcript_118075:164-2524(-)